MIFLFIITGWAFLEALQDQKPSARLISPMLLFSVLRETVEIFLLISLTAGILISAEARFPGAKNVLAALGMMVFYFYGRALKRRESFIWMAYACAVFLVREISFPLIALRGAEIAAGVSAVRMVFKGIQKRQFFSSLPDFADGLPGFFVTAAIISLILSSLFVR